MIGHLTGHSLSPRTRNTAFAADGEVDLDGMEHVCVAMSICPDYLKVLLYQGVWTRGRKFDAEVMSGALAGRR